MRSGRKKQDDPNKGKPKTRNMKPAIDHMIESMYFGNPNVKKSVKSEKKVPGSTRGIGETRARFISPSAVKKAKGK